MALGGRNLAASWIVGIVCLAVVAALVYLATPLGPTALEWLGTLAQNTIASLEGVLWQPEP